MSMEADMLARLVGVAGLSPVGTRIAWGERPRGSSPEFPALVLTQVSPGREWTHDGPDGLDFPRVQFDFYGPSPEQLRTLFIALRDELEATPFTDQGGTRFHQAFLETRVGPTAEDLVDGVRIFRIRCDFQFHHESI